MEYETTPRPIRTHEELADARAKGARIEFTACGPSTDRPHDDRPDTYEDTDEVTHGWINPGHDVVVHVGPNARPGRLVRAFYPVQS